MPDKRLTRGSIADLKCRFNQFLPTLSATVWIRLMLLMFLMCPQDQKQHQCALACKLLPEVRISASVTQVLVVRLTQEVWNPIKQTDMKFYTDLHDPQQMNSTDFGEPTLPLVPPRG